MLGLIIDKIRTEKDLSVESFEKLIPLLGLNDEDLQQQPPEYKEYFGKGLKMWQYPNQLAKLGNFISLLDLECYIEIGCRWGGTFIFINEVLKKRNPHLKSYACDLIDKSDILKEYENFSDFNYFKTSSQDDNFINYCRNLKPTMVFIDGDHSYNGVKNDFKIFENILETKYIIFHDIVSAVCPGVPQFWNEIKEDGRFNYIEFIDQYESVVGNYLGFGILERKVD